MVEDYKKEMRIMNNVIAWSPGVSLASIEKQVILKALQFYHKDRVQTAQALRLPLETLEERLETYETEKREDERKLNEMRERESEFQMRSRGISMPTPSPSFEPKEVVKVSTASKRVRT